MWRRRRRGCRAHARRTKSTARAGPPLLQRARPKPAGGSAGRIEKTCRAWTSELLDSRLAGQCPRPYLDARAISLRRIRLAIRAESGPAYACAAPKQREPSHARDERPAIHVFVTSPKARRG